MLVLVNVKMRVDDIIWVDVAVVVAVRVFITEAVDVVVVVVANVET